VSDVSEIMLHRFGVLYGEPKTSDMDAFIGEYEKLLKGTEKELLVAATDRVIKGQVRRYWPTPGECHKAVNEAAELRHSALNAATPPKREPERPPLTPEERERSRELMRKFHQDMAKNNFVSDLGAKAPAVDRDTWNSRRTVGMSRHGDPIRRPAPTDGTLTETSRRMTGEQD
jgi:hypothetical protein